MQKQLNGLGSQRISHQLAAGAYVVRIQTNEGSQTAKIIVR